MHVCSHLIQALKLGNGINFSQVDHSSTREAVISEMKDRKLEDNEAKLSDVLQCVDAETARSLLKGTKTGHWLSALPSFVNGTELSAQQFRDALLIRYARTPGDLPCFCDGCGKEFTLRHALECKKGGLVHARHDEVKIELVDIGKMALPDSCVRVEPYINLDSPTIAANAKKSNPPNNQPTDLNGPISELLASDDENRGDVLFRGLFQHQHDCIIDVRVTDLDAKSCRSTDPEKTLARQEKEKKSKCLEDCLRQRRSFLPFVVSTDGMLGKEANNLIKRLSQRLAGRWKCHTLNCLT